MAPDANTRSNCYCIPVAELSTHEAGTQNTTSSYGIDDPGMRRSPDPYTAKLNGDDRFYLRIDQL